jgi:hypothetical protein
MIYEKRFNKKLSKYNDNLSVIYWHLNEKEKAFFYSSDKNVFNNKWIPFDKVEKPIKILCLDGGGIRGLSELKMLEYLRDTILNKQENFLEEFDMICGTSTGGIEIIKSRNDCIRYIKWVINRKNERNLLEYES